MVIRDIKPSFVPESLNTTQSSARGSFVKYSIRPRKIRLRGDIIAFLLKLRKQIFGCLPVATSICFQCIPIVGKFLSFCCPQGPCSPIYQQLCSSFFLSTCLVSIAENPRDSRNRSIFLCCFDPKPIFSLSPSFFPTRASAIASQSSSPQRYSSMRDAAIPLEPRSAFRCR